MKPMLAATLTDLIESNVELPIYASAKLDGIRCLMVDGVAVSRALKPIPNRHIQRVLQREAVNGLDGELMLQGKDFNQIQSFVMTEDTEELPFEYCVFDAVMDAPFKDRYKYLTNTIYNSLAIDSSVSVLYQMKIDSTEMLTIFEQNQVAKGHEGIMLRSPDSPYKFGRSTVKEGYLLKYKRFKDAEATIIGFEELQHNENEKTKDALGHSVRSSHNIGKRSGSILGSIIVWDSSLNVEFNIGTGFDTELRKEIWNQQKKYIGKTITYTYQEISSKGVPRFPVFKGIRLD